MTAPILVVGAGPVGLVAACELARRDVPVRIVDALPEPTTESRAVVVHARSLEALARVGVADAVIAAGQRTTAMQMLAGGKVRARLALDTVDSPYPFTVTLPQDETERILTARLAELGVTVERGQELAALTHDADRVRATLAGGEVVEAPYLVGADGAHSTVRHQLGLRLEGSFKGERFLMGDVEADHELEPTSMYTFFSRGAGPMVAFPMLGRRLRLIAQIERDETREATLAWLQDVADERAPGIRLRSAHWLTTFEIHHAQVPRYRDGRVFLAGDAAHVHSPAGGQGMNTGMQDAFNLGWKLAVERPGEALLGSYHAERHPVAARVIRTTTRLTNLATIEHPALRALRDHVVHVAGGLAPVAHLLAEQTEETDVQYRDSPIVTGGRFGHGPAPGESAPLVPELRTGHLVLAIGPAAYPGALRIDDGGRYGFDRHGGFAVVRPDGYLGLVAQASDPGAVDHYFSLVGDRP